MVRSRGVLPAQSITLVLDPDVDVESRQHDRRPRRPAAGHRHRVVRKSLLDASASVAARQAYFLKHTTSTAQVVVTEIVHRLDIQTLEPQPAPAELAMNDLGDPHPHLEAAVSRCLRINRLTGSFILIEQGTNATVAAGMLLLPTDFVKPESTDYTI